MWVIVGLAVAATVTIDATIDADMRTIRGVLSVDAPLVDPLASLAPPERDRDLLRTFPGRPEDGSMAWEPVPAFPGTVRFVTVLPRRFGDLGVLPGRGVWGNGGWYPQPVDAAGDPLVGDWDVTVRGPGTVVVNGRVGAGGARWRGTADRAAVAVLLDAHVTELPAPGGTMTVVDRGPERHAHRWLRRVATAGVTVVEDLDFQRLATAAPGMVFLTDRAFRLTPTFEPYHLGPLREALAAAASPLGDGWDRAFVAAAATRDLPAVDPDAVFGWASWNPVVDEVLHDGTLPYYGDLFDEAWRTPEGALERLADRPPARAVAAQLDTLRGPGTAGALATLLRGGASLRAAAAALGIDPTLVEGWYAAPAAQDYAVRFTPDGVQVTRDAPADAPAEVVRVEVDGAPVAPWVAGPGPAVLTLEGTPARVVVDPDGHVSQEELANDRWPARFHVNLTGGLYNLSVTDGSFVLVGDLVLRRAGDSRNLYLGSLRHDEEDIVGLSLGYLRYLGPNLDRLVRTHRLYLAWGPSLLDPEFRPTTAGAVALGGSAGYAWDTREGDLALKGHRLGVSVGGGVVPGSTEVWASAGASAVGLVPLHPRFVLAGRVKASAVSGDVEHRLLPLGGGDDLRALREDAVLGNQRVVADLEARLAPIRYASVPLAGLVWFTELQIAPGVEAGAVWRDGGQATAVGGTLGLRGVFDGFGARPTLFGVVAATPLWTSGVATEGTRVFVDFEQSF